jgi:hypothetical protein
MYHGDPRKLTDLSGITDGAQKHGTTEFGRPAVLNADGLKIICSIIPALSQILAIKLTSHTGGRKHEINYASNCVSDAHTKWKYSCPSAHPQQRTLSFYYTQRLGNRLSPYDHTSHNSPYPTTLNG